MIYCVHMTIDSRNVRFSEKNQYDGCCCTANNHCHVSRASLCPAPWIVHPTVFCLIKIPYQENICTISKKYLQSTQYLRVCLCPRPAPDCWQWRQSARSSSQPPGYLTQAARSTPAVAWLLSKYIYTHAEFTSIQPQPGSKRPIRLSTLLLNPFPPLRLRVRMCGTNEPCIYSICSIYNI